MPETIRFRPIDGQTRLMGVIGENIAYTRSPAMHNLAAHSLGINAVYLPIDMPAAALPAFLQAAWAMGALGFNVTRPHKETVAALLPDQGLASINTLYRGPHGWCGASTDAEGLARGLLRIGRQLEDFAHIVILGGGGVVVALLAYLAQQKNNRLKQVSLIRRDPQNDATLLAATLAAYPLRLAPWGMPALASALASGGESCLLLQASSAPQHGDDLAGLAPALERYQGVVVDLVYGSPSRLVTVARGKGLAVQDGEAMLIEQARLSQELWWGRSLDYDGMRSALAL